MASPGSGVNDVGHVRRLRHVGAVRVAANRHILYRLAGAANGGADGYSIPVGRLHVVDTEPLPMLLNVHQLPNSG
jgi:hypothetical protein